MLRAAHWLWAFAVLLLIPSGWGIYNAAPLYGFSFHPVLVLGKGLTESLLWHLFAMWPLLLALGGWIAARAARKADTPRILPLQLGGLGRDLRAAASMKLTHRDGQYNQLQRAAYLFAASALIAVIASGLALWKPVQFGNLTAVMGGYETARHVHFWAMAALAAFTLGHVVMAAAVPRTLRAMVFGQGAAQ
jgi:thiosulfate reductase cytochrome b subunit